MNPLSTFRADDLVTPLWRYALELYARPDVAPSCLVLQKSLGVDVCLLMYALYAHQQGRRLSTNALARADRNLKEWRGQVVLPLRKIRETLKAGVPGISIEQSNWVREQIKATEVNAEQVALAYLNTQIASLTQELPNGRITTTKKVVQSTLKYFALQSESLSSTFEEPEVHLAAEIVTTEANSLL